MNQSKEENLALTYYQFAKEKKLTEMAKLLDPKVVLIGPMAEIFGKEAVLKATEAYLGAVQKIEIRYDFKKGETAVVIYDAYMLPPVGMVRGSVLVHTERNLVIRIELFYDTQLVGIIKEEIFEEKEKENK